MAQAELKLEIEMRIFWVKKNPKWKWYKFWEPKEIRTLTECDSPEEIASQVEKGGLSK